MAGGFICNLVLVIWDFPVLWCLEFVISDTKLQGRAIIYDSRNAGQARPFEDPASRGSTRFFKIK